MIPIPTRWPSDKIIVRLHRHARVGFEAYHASPLAHMASLMTCLF